MAGTETGAGDGRRAGLAHPQQLRVVEPSGWVEALAATLLRPLVRFGLRPGLHPRFSPTTQRRWAEAAARLTLPPRGVRFEAGEVAGVAGEWVRVSGAAGTPSAANSACLLYLHGGGYVIGSPRTDRVITGQLCRRLRLDVFVPHYRLAPEHPFPAALDDALAVYRALRQRGPVLVGGDSAGGGLSLATALSARDAGDPLPAALLLISPWVQLQPDAALLAAARAGAEPIGEAMISRAWAEACAKAYAGQTPREHPLISPLRADLRGLPPVMLQVGSDEWLYNDGLWLHRALRAAGVPVNAEVVRRRWHIFQVHAGVLPSAGEALGRLADFGRAALAGQLAKAEQPDTPPDTPPETPEEHEVVILGAGMSGLGMAMALRKAGIHDFVMIEKSAGLGGTWWDNRYPGAHVDVPAPLYSWSFEPNPGWTRRFAAAPEIQAYMQRCAVRHGIGAHLCLNEAITQATWHEAEGRWHLHTDRGRHLVARHFVCSTGPLSQPRWPDIPGLERFAGARLHSARWPEAALAEAALQGRRVAVIGTGSTASQLIPPVAAAAATLTVFQRTANWVLPRIDRPYFAIDRWLARLPGVSQLAYRGWFQLLEWNRRGLEQGSRAQAGLTRWSLRHLEQAVKDTGLRQRLTPSYPLGCKRLVYSNDYWPSLAKPHVRLETNRIVAITPHGVVTADDSGQTTEHAVDTLVCATGFEITHLLAALPITGRNGVRLQDQWTPSATAHRGVTVPGLPNFYLMLGPNTATGHTATLPYIEAQVRFAVAAMVKVHAAGARSIEVDPSAHARYNARLQARFAGTVWTQCQSWYRGPDGRITAIWPGPTREYLRGLDQTDWSEYVVR
jgi:cation diffusion facilitator CzcD-associated flavoprotein CzcO/acetyl esterase/lipase